MNSCKRFNGMRASTFPTTVKSKIPRNLTGRFDLYKEIKWHRSSLEKLNQFCNSDKLIYLKVESFRQPTSYFTTSALTTSEETIALTPREVMLVSLFTAK